MMGRKALAGLIVAKKKGEPAVTNAVIVKPKTPATGLGTGLLGKAANDIKRSMAARKKARDEIMKDL